VYPFDRFYEAARIHPSRPSSYIFGTRCMAMFFTALYRIIVCGMLYAPYPSVSLVYSSLSRLCQHGRTWCPAVLRLVPSFSHSSYAKAEDRQYRELKPANGSAAVF
jgi:hypothetical protein